MLFLFLLLLSFSFSPLLSVQLRVTIKKKGREIAISPLFNQQYGQQNPASIPQVYSDYALITPPSTSTTPTASRDIIGTSLFIIPEPGIANQIQLIGPFYCNDVPGGGPMELIDCPINIGSHPKGFRGNITIGNESLCSGITLNVSNEKLIAIGNLSTGAVAIGTGGGQVVIGKEGELNSRIVLQGGGIRTTIPSYIPSAGTVNYLGVDEGGNIQSFPQNEHPIPDPLTLSKGITLLGGTSSFQGSSITINKNVTPGVTEIGGDTITIGQSETTAAIIGHDNTIITLKGKGIQTTIESYIPSPGEKKYLAVNEQGAIIAVDGTSDKKSDPLFLENGLYLSGGSCALLADTIKINTGGVSGETYLDGNTVTIGSSSCRGVSLTAQSDSFILIGENSTSSILIGSGGGPIFLGKQGNENAHIIFNGGELQTTISSYIPLSGGIKYLAVNEQGIIIGIDSAISSIPDPLVLQQGIRVNGGQSTIRGDIVKINSDSLSGATIIGGTSITLLVNEPPSGKRLWCIAVDETGKVYRTGSSVTPGFSGTPIPCGKRNEKRKRAVSHEIDSLKTVIAAQQEAIMLLKKEHEALLARLMIVERILLEKNSLEKQSLEK